MSKTNILVVSQYFYPEQFRINDICEEWVKRGYNVTVVTGIPNYPQGKFFKGYGVFKKRKEQYKGINIIRIPLIPRGNNSFQLSLNYLSFVISGFFWKTFTKVKADCVFNYETSPITQAYIATWYAKKKSIPCFLYVMDLWPESVQVITDLNEKSFIIKILNKMVKRIYKDCDKIFTSSKSFIGEIIKCGVSEDKLFFWPQYAETFYVPVNKKQVSINEIPQDDNFKVVFAGNIGYAQGLEILPHVAKLIHENKNKIRLYIIGDGRFKQQLIQLVNQENVNDIFVFIDRKEPAKIPKYLAVCDAALIVLKKNELFSKTIPAKIQSCMACGIPIVLSVDGESQDIVKEANCGVFCEAGNAQELYKSILYLSKQSESCLDEMRKNALRYYKNNFEKNLLLNEMDKFLEAKF